MYSIVMYTESFARRTVHICIRILAKHCKLRNLMWICLVLLMLFVLGVLRFKSICVYIPFHQ